MLRSLPDLCHLSQERITDPHRPDQTLLLNQSLNRSDPSSKVAKSMRISPLTHKHQPASNSIGDRFSFSNSEEHQPLKRFLPTTLIALCLVGFTAKPGSAQNFPEPIIDVGIVQRFGSEPADELEIKALTGDRLTLSFETGSQPQTVTTTGSVKLDVQMQPLPEPQVTERVVLSTHRSFESAEDSANQWREKGIAVEIAQPGRWQVWASRDTYRSPLLRRLLFQNLRANGGSSAFLDTQVQNQVPKASFVVNGYRYQRDQLQITTANGRVQVTPDRNGRETRLYAGSLKLQPNAYGTYTLVNRVPIESYLRGVVPHEIGLGAPPTTIEAQAILARTYALRNLRRFTIDNYELCADTQCQVYWGLTGAAPASDQAIAATRGQVLTYNNELVDALYSSTTGGVTAPFGDVWNGPNRPYLQAVVDSVQGVWDLSQNSLSDEANFRAFISRDRGFNEEEWDMFRWRVENSLPEIAADVKAYLESTQHPLANFTQVQGLEVVERANSGRVQKVAVDTNLGRVELEKDEVLRALYAPNSTLFYLEPIYEAAPPVATESSTATPAANGTAAVSPTGQASPNPPARVLKGYAFVGGGLGHGVGMSQTGAYRLGRLGWPHARILSFYYPGTELQPLNENIVFWRDPHTSDTVVTSAEATSAPESSPAGSSPSGSSASESEATTPRQTSGTTDGVPLETKAPVPSPAP